MNSTCKNCNVAVVDSLNRNTRPWNYIYKFTSPVEATREIYCVNCLDKIGMKTCEACLYRFISYKGFSGQVGSAHYCPRCVWICELCKRALPIYSQHNGFSLGDGKYACTKCFNRGHFIKNYDLDVTQFLKFMGKGPLYFGIELELTSKTNDPLIFIEGVKELTKHIDGYAMLKHDGSLPELGFEIVTAPAEIEVHTEKLEKLLPLIEHYFTAEHSRCGMHIHTSRCISHALEFKIFRFLHNKKNIDFFSIIGERDLLNPDIKFYTNQAPVEFLKEFYEFKKNKLYSKKVSRTNEDEENADGEELGEITEDGEPGHHLALTRTDHTLEFRIFKSTTDLNKILKNLEFTLSMYEFVKIGSSLLHPTWIDYTRWLNSSKGYPNLKKFLKILKDPKKSDSSKELVCAL